MKDKQNRGHGDTEEIKSKCVKGFLFITQISLVTVVNHI
jgi:hypothetical protein